MIKSIGRVMRGVSLLWSAGLAAVTLVEAHPSGGGGVQISDHAGATGVSVTTGLELGTEANSPLGLIAVEYRGASINPQVRLFQVGAQVAVNNEGVQRLTLDLVPIAHENRTGSIWTTWRGLPVRWTQYFAGQGETASDIQVSLLSFGVAKVWGARSLVSAVPMSGDDCQHDDHSGHAAHSKKPAPISTPAWSFILEAAAEAIGYRFQNEGAHGKIATTVGGLEADRVPFHAGHDHPVEVVAEPEMGPGLYLGEALLRATVSWNLSSKVSLSFYVGSTVSRTFGWNGVNQTDVHPSSRLALLVEDLLGEKTEGEVFVQAGLPFTWIDDDHHSERYVIFGVTAAF